MGAKHKMKGGEINKYLSELAKVMARNNVGKREIVIVGGAVLSLRYRFGRSTTDIDVCVINNQPEMYKCCLEVAKKYGLSEDWMNGAVMRSPSFSTKIYEKVEFYKNYGRVLNVYTVSDIDLMCMKLVANRPKDQEDLYRVGKRLKRNGKSYDDVVKEFEYLYGNTYMLKSSQRSLLHNIFNNK